MVEMRCLIPDGKLLIGRRNVRRDELDHSLLRPGFTDFCQEYGAMPGAVQKLAQWEPVVYVLSFAFFPHSTHRAPRNESFQLYRSQRHLRFDHLA